MEGKVETEERLLIVHPDLPEKAQDALLVAVQEDWCIQELQPVLYLKTVEDARGFANNANIGSTERVNNLLSAGGIVTIKDLCGLTMSQVVSRTANLGKGHIANIMWALCNFHRHEEGTELFYKALMPNKPPPRTQE